MRYNVLMVLIYEVLFDEVRAWCTLATSSRRARAKSRAVKCNATTWTPARLRRRSPRSTHNFFSMAPKKSKANLRDQYPVDRREARHAPLVPAASARRATMSTSVGGTG